MNIPSTILRLSDITVRDNETLTFNQESPLQPFGIQITHKTIPNPSHKLDYYVLDFDFKNVYENNLHDFDNLSNNEITFKTEFTNKEDDAFKLVKKMTTATRVVNELLITFCKYLEYRKEKMEFLFWSPMIFDAKMRLKAATTQSLPVKSNIKLPKKITLKYFCNNSYYANQSIT